MVPTPRTWQIFPGAEPSRILFSLGGKELDHYYPCLNSPARASEGRFPRGEASLAKPRLKEKKESLSEAELREARSGAVWGWSWSPSFLLDLNGPA